MVLANYYGTTLRLELLLLIAAPCGGFYSMAPTRAFYFAYSIFYSAFEVSQILTLSERRAPFLFFSSKGKESMGLAGINT